MSSNQKPSSNNELKQRILTSIDKLSDRATFTQASHDLNYLAKTLSFEFLPTFLSCILSIDSSSKSPVRVHCISLIPLLSNTHKSSLSSHVSKIVQYFLRRLRDSDTNVRNASVSAISSLSPQNFTLLLDPFLGSISIEQDLNAQIGCCLCLKAAIENGDLEERDEGDLRRRVLPKVLKLLKGDGFKAKGALLGVIESVIGVNGGVVINCNNGGKNGGNLFGNVVNVAVEMLSSEDWMARKSAAEVLLKMAVVLDENSIVEVKSFVVHSLDSRRFDKVKVTREIMNRALEAWKNVLSGPEKEIALSRSNSSISKESGTCGVSTPVPRRYSYGGVESKPKKSMAKCRSSLSDSPVAVLSPSMSPSTQDSIGLVTPKRRKSLSKSRSSLSDDSSITDSSSVSKSSLDIGYETARAQRLMSKGRSSLPLKTNEKKPSVYQNAESKESKKSLDWKIEVAVPPPAPTEDILKDDVKKISEERVPKGSAFKHGSRVVPLVEQDEPRGFDAKEGTKQEVGESNAESEDLSLIRKQLLQIERQQSDLVALIQRFMGNSQSGIDSLETRVSGLERALDEISHDLAVQSGRITDNDFVGSTCCPSTEFLSPKFWRRTEARSSISKSSYSGSMPNKDTNIEIPQIDNYKYYEQNEGICRESWGGGVKGIGQNSQRGRNCSPRSFDTASTATYITSVVPGA